MSNDLNNARLQIQLAQQYLKRRLDGEGIHPRIRELGLPLLAWANSLGADEAYEVAQQSVTVLARRFEELRRTGGALLARYPELATPTRSRPPQDTFCDLDDDWTPGTRM